MSEGLDSAANEASTSGGEGHDASIARLRNEAAEAIEPARRARILHEVAELEEQLGDLVSASRDNLAAFHADDSFLEPLEGLLRLTERRKTLANVGKLLEALVRAARTPDERVRALVLRASELFDVQGDVEGARGALLEATELEAAPGELAIAWLSLEIVAAKLGDAPLREQALAARAERTHHASWRGLLLLDVARLAAADGDIDRALVTCERALEIEGPAAFATACELERLARLEPGTEGTPEWERRGRLIVAALEAQSRMIDTALESHSAGDALGVPRWCRSVGHRIDLTVQTAAAHRLAGNAEAGLTALDHAMALAEASHDDGAALALLRTRLRAGDAAGDGRGLELALQELKRGRAGALAGGLGLRAAAAATSPEAREAALADVTASDPDSLLAEAMRRQTLEGNPQAFVTYLEGLAGRLTEPEAKTRHLVFAAFLAAFRLEDPARAERLLEAAPLDGPVRIALRRAIASVTEDRGALQTALIALAPHVEEGSIERLDGELELFRLAQRGGQEADILRALTRLREDPRGLPLARLLEAFLPAPAAGNSAEAADVLDVLDARSASTLTDRRRIALDELAREGLGDEGDDTLRITFSMMAALETLAAGTRSQTLAAVQAVAAERPTDVFAGALAVALTPIEDRNEAAMQLAERIEDPALAAAFAVQAGLGFWQAGDKIRARASFDDALQEIRTAGDTGAANAEKVLVALVAWTARTASATAEAARSEAVKGTETTLADADTVALERLAAAFVETGLAGGPSSASTASRLAVEALEQLAETQEPTLRRSGALALLGFQSNPEGERAETAADAALSALHAAGAVARRATAAERVRRATAAAAAAPTFGEHSPTSVRGTSLETGSAAPGTAHVHAAREWFGEGGGFPAALAWVVAARARRDAAVAKEDVEHAALEERRALHAAADAAPAGADGGAADMLRIEAALVLAPGLSAVRMPLLDSDRKDARLANLELAPPGCDPRRRASVLSAVGDAVGEAAELDACALAGWSAYAADDPALALDLFRYVTQARPDDLAAWEGQRSAGTKVGDREAVATAGEALGARIADAERAAAFWEEAGNAWLAIGSGYEERGEAALRASFDRAPERMSAFDTLFRRLRDRKAHEAVLELSAQRLAQIDPGQQHVRAEAAKLHWERARALRELGRVDDAMTELTTVRELDPTHVGALALAGEVYIREGRFDAAADTLATLASLEAAPPKSRATAAVTAVDLYENKLSRFDRALEVLDNLYRAGLSTPPTRERFARTAVRAESFLKATEILEVLMQERDTPAGRADAARVALRIHRDHLKAPRGAEKAVTRLLQELPADGEAIDLVLATELEPQLRKRLLTAARESLLAQVKTSGAPRESVADVLRIAQIAQRLGQAPLQQAAVSIAAGLGDVASKESLVQLAAKKPRSPRVALPASALARFRAPGDDGPLRELFMLLGATLSEALGPNLAALQITKKERVDPRGGLGLRNEIVAWAGAFGLDDLELYVGGRDPNLVQGIAGDHPIMVVGSQVNAPLGTALRGRIARELYAIATGTTAVRARGELTVASVVVAACHLAKVPTQAPAYAMLAEVERQVGKAISRKTKNLLGDACQAIVSSKADPLAWIASVQRTHARVALVASGDLPSVLADAPSAEASYGDDVVADLIRFSLSPEYAELRVLLGLEVDAPGARES